MAPELEVQVCNHCREGFIGPRTISCPECQTRAVLTDGNLRKKIVRLHKDDPAFSIVKSWDQDEQNIWLVRRMVQLLTFGRQKGKHV